MARQSGIAEEERKSYSAVFLFLIGMLLAGAAWSIWDENISRRPWKKYQAEFYSDEISRAKADVDKAKEALESNPEYQDLKKRLIEAKARVDSGEQAARLAQIEREKAPVNVRTKELDLNLRIKKSEIEEAWYELEHAQLSGLPTEGPKAHLDTLLGQKQEIDGTLGTSESKEAQLQREVDEINGEVTALEAKIALMEEDRSRLQQRLDGLVLVKLGPIDVPKIPKIEQVVLPDYEKSNFEVALSRVDRCQSCHTAVSKVGYDTEKDHNPLKTHPNKAMMDKHPTEMFGCTPCHEGQGPAVNSPHQAHGEVKFWEDPLLRGEMQQANCIKCHPDSHHLEFADDIGRGQVLFEQMGCHGCHLAEGYDGIAKIGPSLKRIAAKADPSWLVRWVNNPHEFRPNTRMPNFLLTEAQATDVAAFLLDSTKADSQAWLDAHPAPAGVDSANAQLVSHGKELIDSLGCRGCHGIAPGEAPAHVGTDKNIAPNLSGIAEKTDARWTYHWIKNPRGYSSVAKMPSLRLSDEEARAISSYLMTLGTKKENPEVVAKLQEPEAIRHGESLVRKFGCFGCHEVTGMEKESRIGVELSTFGNKGLEELYFGEQTDIPHTWEDWTYNKLKNPRIYQTARIEQLMPQFDLADEDIRALRVFLKSRTEHRMPARLQAQKEARDKKILEGRRLVQNYNCVGCHVIEDRGGAIRQFYTESPTLAPPILNGEGAKVQQDWLYGFIKQPIPLRPWLKVRMPTFGLSDEETTILVEYFAADSHMDQPFVHIDYAKMPKDFIEAGKQLASVEYFSCFSCHQQGDKKPEGPPEGWAPDLSLSRQRLNPDWIVKWLEDPQKLMPGTKMPAFYPGGPEDIFNGDEAKQRDALRDYLLTLGRPASAQQAAAGSADGNS